MLMQTVYETLKSCSGHNQTNANGFFLEVVQLFDIARCAHEPCVKGDCGGDRLRHARFPH
jgi:hypothetical protein